MISHYVIDFGNVTYMSNITRWCNVTPINNIEKTTLANYVILRILVCACTVYAGYLPIGELVNGLFSSGFAWKLSAKHMKNYVTFSEAAL